MEANDDLAITRKTTARPDLAAVKRVYERIDAEGTLPGIEALVAMCHEDVEFRPYAGQGPSSVGGGSHEVLHGRQEVLDFFRRAAHEGFQTRPRAKTFDLTDESVLVAGSIRVTRPDGSFAETNLRWSYHFRDGLIDEISWQSRASS
jgi:ketosteroid isomerase-like protein